MAESATATPPSQSSLEEQEDFFDDVFGSEDASESGDEPSETTRSQADTSDPPPRSETPSETETPPAKSEAQTNQGDDTTETSKDEQVDPQFETEENPYRAKQLETQRALDEANAKLAEHENAQVEAKKQAETTNALTQRQLLLDSYQLNWNYQDQTVYDQYMAGLRANAEKEGWSEQLLEERIGILDKKLQESKTTADRTRRKQMFPDLVDENGDPIDLQAGLKELEEKEKAQANEKPDNPLDGLWRKTASITCAAQWTRFSRKPT